MSEALNLQAENNQLKAQLQAKDNQIESHLKHIQILEELNHLLRHQQYSARSEKLDPGPGLFTEAEALAEADEQAPQELTPPESKKQRSKRAPLPENLERVEQAYHPEVEQMTCPEDGTVLKHIGQEVSEQLDLIPAQLRVIKHIRHKYACPCCKTYVVTAKKPKQAIEKSQAGPSVLAHIAVSKYQGAVPLHRQCQLFEGLGIEFNRTTLARWMIQCGQLVQPLMNRITEHLHEQPVLHMDETPVQVLGEPDKAPQSKSQMWVMSGGQKQPASLFTYHPSRGQQVPIDLLIDFKGALVADGYAGYQAAVDQYQLTRLGCWAHARRKFMEAKRQQPKGKTGRADQALAWIQKLYRIEQQIKDDPPDQRYQKRQSQAQAILDQLKAWLDKTQPKVVPKTTLGKALYYLQSQWPHLVRYIDSGHYPIDNNRAENAIRPFVIGRKNWMFSQSQAGAIASANLYSLIETIKANGLKPYPYLLKLFTDLPQAETLEDIDQLLPWNINLSSE